LNPLHKLDDAGQSTGAVEANVAEVATELVDRHAVTRMWDRDHTLWQADPTDVADRLGWLAMPVEMEERLDQIEDAAASAAGRGLTHALLLGMGGSSLFPLVLAETFERADERLELHVLDTVDPGALARIAETLPLDRTLFVASSKSGTTAETRSLLEWFWEQVGEPDQFAAITDPDTPLAKVARQRGFPVFTNPPDIGGRYSALTYFGLLPGALMGAPVGELLHRAGRMAAATAPCVAAESNPGVRLAAFLAGAALAGRDKLTLVLPDELAAFGAWVEQLVAESTGKAGTGIVPVVGEPLGPPAVYGDDRMFVVIGGDDDERVSALSDVGHPVAVYRVADPVDLGAEVFRWEVAIALTGVALGINPFDQPDVEAAKDAARRALAAGAPDVQREPLDALLAQLRPGDYLAIQAYVDPASPVVERLERVRVALRDRYGVPVTLGVGPRYLHSTGQLHKGGPPTGVFVQVVADDHEDPRIPGEDHGFATLKRAQAAGDLMALREAGRRAGRVDIDELLDAGP